MRNRYWMAALVLALAAATSALLVGDVQAKTQEVPGEVPGTSTQELVTPVNNGFNNNLNPVLSNPGLNTNLGSNPSISGSAGISGSSDSRQSVTPEELARRLASDRQHDLERLPIVDKLRHFTRQ